MSPRFGRDFSRVRVHTDSDAAESADVLDAAAYSVGNDVIFAPGQYRPDSEPGRRLIAHELAHVAQTDSSGSQGDQGHLVRRQTSKGPMADAVPHPQPNPMDSPTFKAGVRLAEFLEAPKRAIAEKIAREFLASRKTPKPSGEPWQPTFSAVTTYAGGLGGGSHFQTPYTVETWSQDEVVAALLPVIKLLGVGDDWTWVPARPDTRPTGEEQTKILGKYVAGKAWEKGVEKGAEELGKWTTKTVVNKVGKKAVQTSIEVTMKSLGKTSFEVMAEVFEGAAEVGTAAGAVGSGAAEAIGLAFLVLELKEVFDQLTEGKELETKEKRIVNAVRDWLYPPQPVVFPQTYVGSITNPPR